LWHVPESLDRDESGPLDWVGAMLATICLGGLVYGLIESPRLGFHHVTVIAALATGVVALALFVFTESKVRNPMMPLHLFRSRNFSGANLLTLLLYAALGGILFFLTLNLIQVQGYSATAAGAAFLPFVLIMFSLSRWSGGLVDRLGARVPLTVGPLIAALGFAMFAIPGVGVSYWISFFPAVVVLGLGMAISVAPLTTTVMSSVSEEQAGVASGINNAVARTAGLLAIAVFGVLLLQTFSRNFQHRLAGIDVAEELRQSLYSQRVKLAGLELPETLDAEKRAQLQQAVTESFIVGFRLTMLVAAGLGLASSATAWLMIGNKEGR
jgi:predicted MFS family arabinose efflux permease